MLRDSQSGLRRSFPINLGGTQEGVTTAWALALRPAGESRFCPQPRVPTQRILGRMDGSVGEPGSLQVTSPSLSFPPGPPSCGLTLVNPSGALWGLLPGQAPEKGFGVRVGEVGDGARASRGTVPGLNHLPPFLRSALLYLRFGPFGRGYD